MVPLDLIHYCLFTRGEVTAGKIKKQLHICMHIHTVVLNNSSASLGMHS